MRYCACAVGSSSLLSPFDHAEAYVGTLELRFLVMPLHGGVRGAQKKFLHQEPADSGSAPGSYMTLMTTWNNLLINAQTAAL